MAITADEDADAVAGVAGIGCESPQPDNSAAAPPSTAAIKTCLCCIDVLQKRIGRADRKSGAVETSIAGSAAISQAAATQASADAGLRGHAKRDFQASDQQTRLYNISLPFAIATFNTTTGLHVSAANSIPLCIDLDGTLIKTDLLLESAVTLLKRRPYYLLLLPFWLLRGRAHLKRKIARRITVDATTLPYDARVREFMMAQAGRPLILCTASDQLAADAVAEYLGGFDSVIGSDGVTNLSGRRKAVELVRRFGERGFDYAGNETRDLAIWQYARAAVVVNGSASLAARAGKACEVARVFPRERRLISAWLKALRPHQWVKNALVLVPLLASHRVLDTAAVLHALAAFGIFCICASSVYLINDMLDLEADRAHPSKRQRPFAAGRLPLKAGLLVAPLLAVCAFAAAAVLSSHFLLVLLGYFALTLAYSLKLKQIVMIDVVVLAALYTARIVAGTAAISAGLSFWLLAFSMFLFLSLALVKRYREVGVERAAGQQEVRGRGYQSDDYELLAALGGASGYLSVLVLALYINSPASAALYKQPQVLWLLCPLLLYWVSRVWIVAHRGAMHDDPVVFAMRDRISQVLLVVAALVVLAAVR